MIYYKSLSPLAIVLLYQTPNLKISYSQQIPEVQFMGDKWHHIHSAPKIH